MFWDWETGEIVRRIDVDSKNVGIGPIRYYMGASLTYDLQIYWSTSGTLVAITSDDSFYILRFDRAAYQAALDSGVELGDEGCEEAFEVVAEIPEK